jgi:hypothetical protein
MVTNLCFAQNSGIPPLSSHKTLPIQLTCITEREEFSDVWKVKPATYEFCDPHFYPQNP